MSAVAETDGLRELADAYARPWEAADRWRAAGGRVVGLFGRYAPAEIVYASGALPIRLEPAHLSRSGAPAKHLMGVPEGLKGELSAGPLEIVSSLLKGDLDWIDGLLIGRDSEAHTKLFYVIREMAGDPEFSAYIPQFAFSDLLRLPVRTSAVYNRVRLRQLQETVAGWWGRAATADSLRDAISAEARTRGMLSQLDAMRADRRVSGRQMLVAALGAQVLPSPDATAALGAAVDALRRLQRPVAAPGVVVTGSEPTPEIYDVIEASGLVIVGDDHCCPGGWPEPQLRTADPIDALADAYQLSSVGAARAGLDRAAEVASTARRTGADAVVQIVLPGDEASEWELAELQGLLRSTPVISVNFDPADGYDALRDSCAELANRLREDPGLSQIGSGVARD